MKLKTILTTVAIISISTATMAQGNGNGNGKGNRNHSDCGETQGYHQNQNSGGFHNKDGEGHATRLREELKLTDKQFNKLDSIRKSHHDEMKKNRDATRELRTAVREELKKEKPSKTTTDKLSSEIGTLHAEMSKAMVVHFLEIKNILSNEQFKQLLDRDHHKNEPRKNR